MHTNVRQFAVQRANKEVVLEEEAEDKLQASELVENATPLSAEVVTELLDE